MDKHLPRLYKDYGSYSNYRNFPLDLDGLKPVERRVLLAAFKISKSKFVKSRRVDSHTTGHYHPHGECYGTIVQLVRQGFLDGQGNFGTNVGVEPVGAAAPRYTECKISENTVDLAFKYVNFVPWGDTELEDKEPLFLPTRYPLCLMGNDYTQGIGFGYKTFIPCYKREDLYKRLLWLLGIRKRKPIIHPITDCTIVSDQKVLDQLLTTGSAKIDVEGIIEEIPTKNKVVLKSWPPGKRFASFLNKFATELDSNMIGFTDLSVSETQIVFQVLRERNRDKIYNEFVEKLKEVIKGTISFETTVVDIDHKVLVKPIDQMLLDTFKMFSEANEAMLKYEIAKFDEKINEYQILEKIRQPISHCVSKSLDIKDTLKFVQDKTGILQKEILELINKYRISKMMSLNTDTTELKEKQKEFKNNLKNLNNFVLEQYNEF
jgi:DNA gyrase/topoisomerase IV subunit A